MAAGERIETGLLEKLVPFSSLSETHLAELSRKGTVEEHPRGSILFKRGEENRHCHYLLAGSVDLADADFNITQVSSADERAHAALDTNQPHMVTAITTSPVRVLLFDKDYVDLVLTWDQAGNYLVQDLEEDEVLDADADWMSCLLQSRLFTSIPPANIQQLFAKFEEARVKADDVVVNQGDPGDFFYVVKSGVARISRRIQSGGDVTDVVLAELRAGDVFGEDALIGDAPRNATVKMVTDGSLMRLDKKDFSHLMQDPVLEFIEFEELEALIAEGERKIEVLDVRLPLEFKQGHIEGSRSVPLHAIRKIVDELDADVTYITTCDGGRRSTLAAYLLNQYGFEALVLKDPPDLESSAA